MIKSIKDHIPIIKDLGIVLFLIVVMYLNQHYVTVDKFDSYAKGNELAHSGIMTTLSNVDKTLALMQQNQEILIENQKQIQVNTVRLTKLEFQIEVIQKELAKLQKE